MPSFDVVSEFDAQEVKNAVEQALREAKTRFDFKGTDSTIELGNNEITLESASEERLRALRNLLEEKLVKRQVSLKILHPSEPENATQGRKRQHIKLVAGIDKERAKIITKLIKDSGVSGVSNSIQGDLVRVIGKKRDALQAVIAYLRESKLDFPLQFVNFRD